MPQSLDLPSPWPPAWPPPGAPGGFKTTRPPYNGTIQQMSFPVHAGPSGSVYIGGSRSGCNVRITIDGEAHVITCVDLGITLTPVGSAHMSVGITGGADQSQDSGAAWHLDNYFSVGIYKANPGVGGTQVGPTMNVHFLLQGKHPSNTWLTPGYPILFDGKLGDQNNVPIDFNLNEIRFMGIIQQRVNNILLDESGN